MLLPDAVAKAAAGTGEPTKMPVRTLGKTGVKLPILSMGVDRPDSPTVVRAAYNSGIMHFDTANGYQNGRNEEMLGNFLEDKPRDSYFIATKIMFPRPSLRDNFEEDFTDKLETSLARLKMKQVDLLYIHDIREPETVKSERIMAILQKVKAEGKTRFIGFSTHDQKAEIIDAGVDAGIYDVALIGYNFKTAYLEQYERTIQRAADAGMGLIVMKALAGGVEDAEGKKKINASACLKWVWKNKNITTIIPGLFNYDQLEESVAAAMSPGITGDEEVYLAALRGEEMMYCQQCRQCIGQCPNNLPIPDIMRAYMYNYGYRQSQKSKDTLLALDLREETCKECGTCKVTYPSGFDVARKIAAVTPVTKIPDEFLA